MKMNEQQFKELHSQNPEPKIMKKCFQGCYQHMRENCQMCGFEQIECPDCNEFKTQLSGDRKGSNE